MLKGAEISDFRRKKNKRGGEYGMPVSILKIFYRWKANEIVIAGVIVIGVCFCAAL